MKHCTFCTIPVLLFLKSGFLLPVVNDSNEVTLQDLFKANQYSSVYRKKENISSFEANGINDK